LSVYTKPFQMLKVRNLRVFPGLTLTSYDHIVPWCPVL
jgi:hypothetical protein